MLAYNKRCILEADPNHPRDGTTDMQEEFILEAAWTKETSRSTDVINTDIDLECPPVFEQRLFEKSAQSDSAGNYQWGLDAGTHMLGFDPTGTTRITMKEIPTTMKTSLRCYAC
ncbi:hypothetical protein BDR05DRAFT_956984 [Suillus weaverae]|nr:hypothetical protein BDR05DRAFT_956984 [Suillus weaverae]